MYVRLSFVGQLSSAWTRSEGSYTTPFANHCSWLMYAFFVGRLPSVRDRLFKGKAAAIISARHPLPLIHYWPERIYRAEILYRPVETHIYLMGVTTFVKVGGTQLDRAQIVYLYLYKYIYIQYVYLWIITNFTFITVIFHHTYLKGANYLDLLSTNE